jgi:hypothetical protein
MSETVMSPQIDKLAPALLKAQTEMSNAVKDSKNPFFKSKYADLNSIREASHPSLNSNGIMVLQPMVQKEGKSFVRTMLMHSSGQFIGSDTEVVCAKVNDPQAYGSAVSYARRYGLQALISLGAEDNDAEAAMGRPVTKETASTSTTPSQTSSFRKPKSKPAAEIEQPATQSDDWT